MRRMKFLFHFFTPGFHTVAALSVFALVTPLLALLAGWVGFYLPYATFLLALYVLVALFLRLPMLFLSQGAPTVAGLFRQWFAGPFARAKLSLLFGILGNLTFAMFCLVMGAVSRSFWMGTQAVYYIMLSLLRFLVAQKAWDTQQEKLSGRWQAEWNSYVLTEKLLPFLGLALGGMLLSTLTNRQKEYSFFLFGAFALFALFRVGISVFHLLRYRHTKRPAFLLAKALSLTAALPSLYTLQITLLARLPYPRVVRICNAATGVLMVGGVFGLVFFLKRNENIKA